MTAATGILRSVYRRALGEQAGGCRVYTTTGTSSATDARRQIICTSLIDDEAERSRLVGRYLAVTSGAQAGLQARVLRAGYFGGTGLVELSRPAASAVLSGSEIELTWPLPSDSYLDIDGLNQCVVWALRHCVVDDRLDLVGNGTRSYDLASYADYLDADVRVDSIWDTRNAASSTAPYEASPFPVRVESDGGALVLVTGTTYTTSEAFQVRLFRQGHTLVKSAGVWAASTTGPTSDTQAAAVPVSWVVVFGMVRVLQVVAEQIERDETLSDATRARRLAENARARQRWAAAACDLAEHAFPQPSDPMTTAMLWTPRTGGTFETPGGSSTSLPVSSLP